ncbi:MAG: helix-turn-helix domain-containing protein [Gammaproteobacteria bacterium]|nr:helix-turn-helix domain-containing protein [Gammaproteobacteria bacterium]
MKYPHKKQSPEVCGPRLAYTMNETMRQLRISRATLYELIQSQKLRTYKIGRRRYCTRDALLDMQQDLENDTKIA